MLQVEPRPTKASHDFLPIEDVDYIEFYVGNAKQAAYFYRSALGMQLTAYQGPETGVKDRASYVVEQNRVRFVLTTPLKPTGPIADHIKLHGDGVRDVALRIADATVAYREATQRGARGVREPDTLKDKTGSVRLASIASYGDTIHTFVERKNYRGVFLPGFTPVRGVDPVAAPNGLRRIDHVVGNVELGKMNEWVRFYADVLGFHLY